MNKTNSSSNGTANAPKIISSYTRAQAIEDGVLVDVSEIAREVGIKYPVALTSAVWHAYVALTPAAEDAGGDTRGRTFDILWMLRLQIRRRADASEMLYGLRVVTASVKPSAVTLKAVCGPGDTPEPVITIMLPEED